MRVIATAGVMFACLSSAMAAEVNLVCEGAVTVLTVHGAVNEPAGSITTSSANVREQTSQVSRRIRFDEAAGVFEYLGATNLKGSDGGDAWVSAHEVEFQPDKILVTFKVSEGKRALGLLADVSTFGISRIKGGRKDIVRGELNRMTGIWSIEDQFDRPTFAIPCVKAEEIERKF